MELIRKVIRRILHWSMNTKYKFATCGENVELGHGFFVNYPQRLYIGSHISIGAYATINSLGGVRIGSGTISGPFLHIYSANHKYLDGKALPFDEDQILKSVDIGENVWIGGDVVILPGVTIGEGAVIGAGSVVTKDVKPGHVVAGYPAKTIKQRNMDHYDNLKIKGCIFRKDIKQRTSKKRVGEEGPNRREIGEIPKEWDMDAKKEREKVTWLDISTHGDPL
ncbi:MAG: acyltransferase [Desulfamplus sp.]|nr:acyltransferase [Desulfamplus sp.]